ncbi:MAG: sigma-54-dependent Fis family transcriptional regulator, partial [Deltaproteobacteria bacterium]
TIRAMKLGAFEFIHKPIDITELDQAIQKIRASAHDRPHPAVAAPEGRPYRHNEIIGRSRVMKEIFKLIGLVSQSRITVLLQGESGTGKELVARAIHENSDDQKNPFVAINCAAIVDTLLESELFGHEKGAFTGAVATKEGKFEQAHHGTLFLDEIGEMPLNLQAKLLRVIQEGEFQRVGGKQRIEVDLRIVAATNRDLFELVRQGKFREDLYYRLKVVTIELPPLRERKEDIPDLVAHLIRKNGRRLRKNVTGVTVEAMDRILRYHWPGNVRELENCLVKAIALAKGALIHPDQLEGLEVESPPPRDASPPPSSGLPRLVPLDDVIRDHILHVLAHTGGNKSLASKILGISRPNLDRKIQRFGISVRDFQKGKKEG